MILPKSFSMCVVNKYDKTLKHITAADYITTDVK